MQDTITATTATTGAATDSTVPIMVNPMNNNTTTRIDIDATHSINIIVNTHTLTTATILNHIATLNITNTTATSVTNTIPKQYNIVAVGTSTVTAAEPATNTNTIRTMIVIITWYLRLLLRRRSILRSLLLLR